MVTYLNSGQSQTGRLYEAQDMGKNYDSTNRSPLRGSE